MAKTKKKAAAKRPTTKKPTARKKPASKDVSKVRKGSAAEQLQNAAVALLAVPPKDFETLATLAYKEEAKAKKARAAKRAKLKPKTKAKGKKRSS